MKKKNIQVAGIAGLVVMAATAFYIVRKKSRNKRGAPPSNAPQLPIENPGDQSEFPAAATGEKDLG